MQVDSDMVVDQDHRSTTRPPRNLTDLSSDTLRQIITFLENDNTPIFPSPYWWAKRYRDYDDIHYKMDVHNLLATSRMIRTNGRDLKVFRCSFECGSSENMMGVADRNIPEECQDRLSFVEMKLIHDIMHGEHGQHAKEPAFDIYPKVFKWIKDNIPSEHLALYAATVLCKACYTEDDLPSSNADPMVTDETATAGQTGTQGRVRSLALDLDRTLTSEVEILKTVPELEHLRWCANVSTRNLLTLRRVTAEQEGEIQQLGGAAPGGVGDGGAPGGGAAQPPQPQAGAGAALLAALQAVPGGGPGAPGPQGAALIAALTNIAGQPGPMAGAAAAALATLGAGGVAANNGAAMSILNRNLTEVLCPGYKAENVSFSLTNVVLRLPKLKRLDLSVNPMDLPELLSLVNVLSEVCPRLDTLYLKRQDLEDVGPGRSDAIVPDLRVMYNKEDDTLLLPSHELDLLSKSLSRLPRIQHADLDLALGIGFENSYGAYENPRAYPSRMTEQDLVDKNLILNRGESMSPFHPSESDKRAIEAVIEVLRERIPKLKSGGIWTLYPNGHGWNQGRIWWGWSVEEDKDGPGRAMTDDFSEGTGGTRHRLRLVPTTPRSLLS